MTALPTLLYGSDIWSLNKDELSRLASWQNRCMRYMLGIRYKLHEFVSGNELRQKCRLPKIETLLRTSRLRWFGMQPERVPRKMITAHLGAQYPVGRPRTNWRQVITEDVMFIDCADSYADKVKNRDSWRATVHGPQSRRSDWRP